MKMIKLCIALSLFGLTSLPSGTGVTRQSPISVLPVEAIPLSDHPIFGAVFQAVGEIHGSLVAMKRVGLVDSYFDALVSVEDEAKVNRAIDHLFATSSLDDEASQQALKDYYDVMGVRIGTLVQLYGADSTSFVVPGSYLDMKLLADQIRQTCAFMIKRLKGDFTRPEDYEAAASKALVYKQELDASAPAAPVRVGGRPAARRKAKAKRRTKAKASKAKAKAKKKAKSKAKAKRSRNRR